MMGYYLGYDGYGHIGYSFFGGLLMFAFWLFVILLIFFSVKKLIDHENHHRHMSSGKNALDILKERYAKGEISRSEFEEKKKDIEN